MSYQNFLGYAGDILAVDAYALLKGDSTSVLIDVRTQAEWTYVGTPDIQALGKTPLFLEWQSYPSMAVDANFVPRLEALLRVGGRSARRFARVLVPFRRAVAPRRNRDDRRGMVALFQCVGRVRRRAGRLAPERGGWRVEGGRIALDADVKRRANPVSRHRRNVGCPPNARDTTMDMYDEPDPDRFDHGGSGGPPFGEAWRRCCDRLRAEVGDAVFNSWFGSLTLESVGSGQARLSVPTRFLKSWIVTHYAGHVASALNAEVGPVGQILISVRSSAPLAPLTRGPLPDCASPAKTADKPAELSVDRAAADRRPPNRTPAALVGRRRLDRISPRSAADLRHVPGWAVE